jgi:LemA protein
MKYIFYTLIILIVLAVLVVLWIIGVYNKMVRGKNLVEESWNQIDVELNRRYDLIPNLVNTIKGATAHEKETLESVIGLRNQAAALAGSNASPAQRAQVEEQLTSQLQNLVNVTVEKYPELRANENFLKLQSELSEIESRIANSRKYYNANVGNFNTLIESFPNSIIAGGRFKKASYFQIQDPAIRQNPVVDFSTSPAPATPPADTAEAPALTDTTSAPIAIDASTIPTQVADPFPETPAPAGDYSQPDFSQSSKVKDK